MPFKTISALFSLLIAAAPVSAQAAAAVEKIERAERRAKPVGAQAVAQGALPASSGVSVPAGASAPVTLPSFTGPSSPAASAALAPMCGTEERQTLDKLTAANMIEQQKSQQKLRPVNEERDETAARYNVLFEKQKLDLAPLEAELRKLQLESNLQDEKFRRELASLRQERDRVRMQNELAREKLSAEQIKAEAEKLKMDIAMRDLDFQSRKLRMDVELADHRTVALKTDLELRDKKEKWKKAVDRDPVYAKDPFKDGVLTVSDRRIVMNGPIVYGTADYVTERIHFYNNQSEALPIFLVIDRSPGGSVMEGDRILKAIHASKAPVHVVVKSMAASMAAAIATLAPRSYAHPNAVIMHHQIISFTMGNPTQQKQQLDIINEWNRRMLTPVAKKMGMNLDQLTRKMYDHSVDGDWEEFADKAQKLGWVDHVVSEIRETGILKEPEDKKEEKPRLLFGLGEEQDPRGERYVRLPRLQPYDAYFIHNRDNYYR